MRYRYTDTTTFVSVYGPVDSQPRKTITIKREAVRETTVPRHHGAQLGNPLKPLGTPALWYKILWLPRLIIPYCSFLARFSRYRGSCFAAKGNHSRLGMNNGQCMQETSCQFCILFLYYTFYYFSLYIILFIILFSQGNAVTKALLKPLPIKFKFIYICLYCATCIFNTCILPMPSKYSGGSDFTCDDLLWKPYPCYVPLKHYGCF